ncbi:ribonuclease H-like [Dermatophagoides farinae]|uniref:ribonuclease H-like n=1 Tax=Dermatophagoides farinae TaxID=6954 RepID=UPI003F60F92E
MVHNKDSTLVIYTDGSCKNNGQLNSKSGYGIHFEIPDIPDFYGKLDGGTNNSAELTAILRALDYIKSKYGEDVHAKIYTDSEYSINGIDFYRKKRMGLHCTGNYQANQDLLNQIVELLILLPNVLLLHVKGHKGIEGNVIADKLSREYLKEEEE